MVQAIKIRKKHQNVVIKNHYWVLNFKQRSLKSFVHRTCSVFFDGDDLN
jgi:hypothetical protein